MTHNNKNGFTLIELLVVISIIGMLSSIILVSLRNARKSGDLASVITFDTYNYHKLGSNTVVEYLFDDPSNLGKDTSGKGYNLTVMGNAVSAPGYDSKTSLNIPGSGADGAFSNSIPHVNLISSGAKGITVSFWAKAISSNSGYLFHLINDNLPNNNHETLYCSGSSPSVPILKNSANSGVKTPDVIFSDIRICNDTSSWHNVTISYRYYGIPNTVCNKSVTGEGLLSVYIDGKIINKDSCGFFIKTNIVALAIGNSMSVGTNYISSTPYSGYIDNFRIYGDVLTASEAQKLYVEGLKTHTLAKE